MKKKILGLVLVLAGSPAWGARIDGGGSGLSSSGVATPLTGSGTSSDPITVDADAGMTVGSLTVRGFIIVYGTQAFVSQSALFGTSVPVSNVKYVFMQGPSWESPWSYVDGDMATFEYVQADKDPRIHIVGDRNSQPGFLFGDEDSKSRGYAIYSNESDTLIFGVNGADVVNIDSATALIAGNLEVDGSLGVDAEVVFRGSATFESSAVMQEITVNGSSVTFVAGAENTPFTGAFRVVLSSKATEPADMTTENGLVATFQNDAKADDTEIAGIWVMGGGSGGAESNLYMGPDSNKDEGGIKYYSSSSNNIMAFRVANTEEARIYPGGGISLGGSGLGDPGDDAFLMTGTGEFTGNVTLGADLVLGNIASPETLVASSNGNDAWQFAGDTSGNSGILLSNKSGGDDFWYWWNAGLNPDVARGPVSSMGFSQTVGTAITPLVLLTDGSIWLGPSDGNRSTFTVTGGLILNDTLELSPALITVPSEGTGAAASFTLDPSSSSVQITCSDANGCDATMGESSPSDGSVMKIFNMSANTVNFADTAGVSELAGAFPMGQYDSLELHYVSDRWIEVSRSNN